MKSAFEFFICSAASMLCLFGCGGSNPVGNNPGPGAPQILNFTVNPEVICVGATADISFEVIDPNQDAINWMLKLNTNIHGTPEQNSGTNTSGTEVDVRFKAATSGRHRHRVVLTVSAADSGGLQAQSQSKDLFVFNCS